MMLLNALIAYVSLTCINSYPYVYGAKCDQQNEKLTPEQEGRLKENYHLTRSPLGPLLSGQMWTAQEQLGDKPQAQGRLLVAKSGFCAKWIVFSIDQFYHWHEGKAVIQKIHPNGTLVSECLGSTALYADCKYVVSVPKGWYFHLEVTGNFAVSTLVLLNGDRQDGHTVGFSAMMKKFGDSHCAAIGVTKSCYQ